MSSDNPTIDCIICCKENVTFFPLPCNHYSCIKCISKILKTKPIPDPSTNIVPPPSCPFCQYAVRKIKLDNDEGCLKRKIKKSSTNEK
ncbi:8882_t:CDS:2, partial [Cetraspora pellucida]